MAGKCNEKMQRYERGIRLEMEGYSAQQVAEKLGYRDARSWISTKSYYKKSGAEGGATERAAAGARAKAAIEQRRAAEAKPEDPRQIGEAPILAGLQLERVTVRQRPYISSKFEEAQGMGQVSKADEIPAGKGERAAVSGGSSPEPEMTETARLAAQAMETFIRAARDAMDEDELMEVSTVMTLEGLHIRYRWDGTCVSILQRSRERRGIQLGPDGIKRMIKELQQLAGMIQGKGA